MLEQGFELTVGPCLLSAPSWRLLQRRAACITWRVAGRLSSLLYTPHMLQLPRATGRLYLQGRALWYYTASAPMSQGIKKVSAAEAAELLKSGITYLDVRTPEEFSGGHAEGAVNIPLMYRQQGSMTPNPEFEHQVKETLPDNQQQIVVGCKAGGRSAKACQMLSKEYPNLIDNTTGWDGWVEANLPVSK